MSWVVWLLGAAGVVGLVVVAALGWLERRAYIELAAAHSAHANAQRQMLDAQSRLIETNWDLISAQSNQIRLLEARAGMAADLNVERSALWTEEDEMWEPYVVRHLLNDNTDGGGQ